MKANEWEIKPSKKNEKIVLPFVNKTYKIKLENSVVTRGGTLLLLYKSK